jgi:hypothetical protein
LTWECDRLRQLDDPPPDDPPPDELPVDEPPVDDPPPDELSVDEPPVDDPPPDAPAGEVSDPALLVPVDPDSPDFGSLPFRA